MNHLIQTLQHIQTRPGMYFGDTQRGRSLYMIQAFIVGYQVAELGRSSSDFECFNEWVAIHYRVLSEGRGWFHLILEHVGGDERLGFDEFFRLLPDFIRDKQQLGRDAIISRFCEIQEECFEAFKKENHDT